MEQAPKFEDSEQQAEKQEPSNFLTHEEIAEKISKGERPDMFDHSGYSEEFREWAERGTYKGISLHGPMNNEKFREEYRRLVEEKGYGGEPDDAYWAAYHEAEKERKWAIEMVRKERIKTWGLEPTDPEAVGKEFNIIGPFPEYAHSPAWEARIRIVAPWIGEIVGKSITASPGMIALGDAGPFPEGTRVHFVPNLRQSEDDSSIYEMEGVWKFEGEEKDEKTQ
jgi:hypothetical protein